MGGNVYRRIAHGAKRPYTVQGVHGANCPRGEKSINPCYESTTERRTARPMQSGDAMKLTAAETCDDRGSGDVMRRDVIPPASKHNSVVFHPTHGAVPGFTRRAGPGDSLPVFPGTRRPKMHEMLKRLELRR